MRVTERELRHDVELLQRQGIDIAIHWAYGQPRCTTKDEGSDLSPRLSKGDMAIWLHGFDAGIKAEQNRIKTMPACISQDKFKYNVLIAGGVGPNVWDREIEVEAPGVKQAVEVIESTLESGAIVSIEQVD